MDHGQLQAVRERQAQVREEIVRHRFGASLHASGTPTSIVLRCRRVLGRVFVGFGRMLEGDDPMHEGVSMPCN